MNKFIKFKKLYQNVGEGEFGNALIQIRRFPFEFRTDSYLDVGRTGNYNFKTMVKYSTTVYIDLWFILLRFKWISRNFIQRNEKEINTI